MPIQPDAMALLVCPVPACRSPLEQLTDVLRCTTCGLQYRIEGPWPVLIPEEAQPAEES